MVAGSRLESGDPLTISSKVRSTVKSIKEVVGDHSESDIYAALKETNMDPDEAAQKLLNQGVVFSFSTV
jgi:GBF-interacting protein 1 N-terminal